VPGPVAYGDFDRGSGARAMEELLATGEPFDGLFVASDLMAVDALAVLRSTGCECRTTSRWSGSTTTVRQPVEEMAKALTLTLLDRIGDPDAPITSRVFPPKLIPRAST
jgi:DNA-binding LacI/PurR family transcriptional regulator